MLILPHSHAPFLLFTVCPTEVIPLSGSGKISSPNYPKSNYTASRNCTWKITGPADKIVKFRFTDFVLSECSANPCLDSCSYVELYDGLSTSSPLLGRFCQGSSWNETQLSTGNQMFVIFHPGQTVDQGFEAKYDSTMTSVVPTSVPTKVAQKTDGPPATGTSNTNVAIIAVPTVFVAVIIASSMYIYHKRKSSKIYDIQTAERPVSTNSEENDVESSV